jgi:hypothetical protein
MADTLDTAGVVDVGLYSTASQWASIAGAVTAGPLLGRPTWLAGATGIGPARRSCDLPPLTDGGTVVMVQFVDGGFDRDYVCD